MAKAKQKNLPSETVQNDRRRVTTLVSVEDMMRWTVRLEESIGKLATATTDLSVVLSAHTSRIDNVERQTKQQQDDFRVLQSMHTSDYKFLNERITTVHLELTEKLENQTEQLTAVIERQTDKLGADQVDCAARHAQGDKELDSRINALEKWRWLVVGGAAVGAMILTGVLLKVLEVAFGGVNWVKALLP